jgi:hypothetical protein
MIYSYGCSFSTRQLVEVEDFWVHLLAKHYKTPYEAWGTGGNEYHEAFHRLLGCMHEFKKDDLIVFEFTDHTRIGVTVNGTYLTTAIITRATLDETMEHINHQRIYNGIDKEDEDYTSLYDFSNIWADSQMFYHYWRVWNLLTYLQDTVGIHFILLFLDQTWANVIPEDHYKNIPMFELKKPYIGYENPKSKVRDPDKNISLAKFCFDRAATIGGSDKYKEDPRWHPEDGHPDDLGNRLFAEQIINHINTHWDETNPYRQLK